MITAKDVITTEKAQELYDLLMPIYRNLEDLVIGTMLHYKSDVQRQKLIDYIKSGITNWTKIMIFGWKIDEENMQEIRNTW